MASPQQQQQPPPPTDNNDIVHADTASPHHQQQEHHPKICPKCTEYLCGTDSSENGDDYDKDYTCEVCLDLWKDTDAARKILQTTLEKACEPYGGISRNRFSVLQNQSTTISIAGDLYLRYHHFLVKSNMKNNIKSGVTVKPVDVWYQDLKHHLHDQIDTIIMENQSSSPQECEWIELDQGDDEYGTSAAATIEKEEQGYLTIHLLCVPPPKTQKTDTASSTMNVDVGDDDPQTRKRKRQQKRQFRQHNGPYACDTQGGHPLSNLEMKLRRQSDEGYDWLTVADAKKKISSSLGRAAAQVEPNLFAVAEPIEFHVAVHRRPIYLYGYYTKTRRDVSQTPFFVATTPQSRTTTTTTTKSSMKLGLTSVEEQICRPIVDLLGISTMNNFPLGGTGGETRKGGGLSIENSSSSQVKYGMCKFHASGREDMDVRMLVRRPQQQTPSTQADTSATLATSCRGRPFCIQMIDALNPLRSKSQLQQLIDTVNHTSQEKTGSNSSKDQISVRENEDTMSYGRNPFGVGISPETFKMVPSSVFSGLQEDTESKVKHYGSVCWSERRLPPAPAGTNDLTSTIFPPDQVEFPLTLQQKTPLRVLHRRANTVRERQVLCAKATRIDDHHFRLQMSTQAGTYVKEFVHGDLRRTQPSVSSIMECKTTLLELDCEGIEFGLA